MLSFVDINLQQLTPLSGVLLHVFSAAKSIDLRLKGVKPLLTVKKWHFPGMKTQYESSAKQVKLLLRQYFYQLSAGRMS